MKRIEQAVLWRRLDGAGHDACAHGPTGSGWRVMGTAVFLSDGAPANLGYVVDAAADWRVRSAHVFGTVGTQLVDVFVAVRDGTWLLNGVRQPRTAGAVDFELGFTPATKLFTLRRHALAVGAHAEVEGVELQVLRGASLEPMRSRCARLSDVDYAFDGDDTRRSVVLRVDRHRMVVHVPGAWEREDGRRAAPSPHGPHVDRARARGAVRADTDAMSTVAGE